MGDLKVVGAVVLKDRLLVRNNQGVIRNYPLVSFGDEVTSIPADSDPDGLIWQAIERAANPLLQVKKGGTVAPVGESKATAALHEILDVAGSAIFWDEPEKCARKIMNIANAALSEDS